MKSQPPSIHKRLLLSLGLSLLATAGCQSVQPSLRLQRNRTNERLQKPNFEQDRHEDFRAAKLIELETGVIIRIGTPKKTVLESLGHPALKIYEGHRIVWVLADSSEVSFVGNFVSDIEFSQNAYFDENGYYDHHRMRHHGAVEAILSARTPIKSRKGKKKSSIKKLANPPKIIRGPWVWHGPLFGQKRAKPAATKVVRKPRRPTVRRRGGISIILIR
ncbi:MAG: hypothetical protein P1V97_30635 [Planctomycetota bacterium]|nr:hypothetical protein [Planctomycetota bacterium]